MNKLALLSAMIMLLISASAFAQTQATVTYSGGSDVSGSKTIGTQSFTSWHTWGGASASNFGSITVTGNCTITLYAGVSATNTSARNFSVVGSTFSQTQSNNSTQGVDYAYTGGAGTVKITPVGGGGVIYGVFVTYPVPPTPVLKPTLSDTTLSGFTTKVGVASANKSFTISGQINIGSSTLSITVPAGYEISIGYAYFSAPLNITANADGTIPTTTISVRLQASQTANPSVAGNIEIVSSYLVANDNKVKRTVALSGSVVPLTLEDGLIAKFLFSGNIKDSSTYNHTVYDINGNTSFKADRFGSAGKALNITNTGGTPIAIQIAYNPVFYTYSVAAEYSVSCWIYSGQLSYQGDNYILCQKYVPSQWLSTAMPDYDLSYGCTSDYWLKNTPNYGLVAGPNYLNCDKFPWNRINLMIDQTWNHYVVTRKDSITKFYMNGDSVFQYKDTGRHLETCYADMNVWFMFWPGNGSDSRLDDAFLYNRKLTDTEVKLLFGNYKNPVTNLSEKKANTAAYKVVNNELIFDQTYKKIELMDISGRKLLSLNNASKVQLQSIPSNVLLVGLYQDNKATKFIKIVKP